MRIVSTSGLTEVDELARIEFKNAITGKVHSVSVWASDTENKDYEPFHVFMTDLFELDYRDLYEGVYGDALSDNLWDGYLSDLIGNNIEIKKLLVKNYEEDESDFDIEIPAINQKMDLHSIIVEQEFSDILYKIDQRLLEKSDLVNFGKLVEQRKHRGIHSDQNLNDVFNRVLSESMIENEDIPYLKATYESLDMNIPNELTKDDRGIFKNRILQMNYEELHAEAEKIIKNISAYQLTMDDEVDKIAVIIPFLDKDNYDVYGTALETLRTKGNNADLGMSVNYSSFIWHLEGHQQEKIEEVVKYQLEKIQQIEESDSYINDAMNSRLSDLESLISREQLTILMNRDEGLTREMSKNIPKYKVGTKKKRAFEMER